MSHSTLTSKGQTTIPLEVRQALKLKPRQRILYEVKGDAVILKVEQGGLLDLYGSLKSKLPAPDKRKMREHYRRSRVGRYVNRPSS